MQKHMTTILHGTKWTLALLTAWFSSVPDAIWTLAVFTILDLLFGIAEHYAKRDICSIEARAGSVRKLMQLVIAYIICLGELRLGLTAGLGKAFCFYLTVIEFISIIEHYAAVGGPISRPLLQALVNVRNLAPKSATPEEIRRALSQKAGKGS